MNAHTKPLMCMLGFIALTNAATPATAAGLSNDALIKRALSAAPERLRNQAAVVLFDDTGRGSTLRKSTNGWTCVPYDVGTPTRSPLCLDQGGLEWYSAALAGKAPEADIVGYSYMLQGGSAWSNVNPTATKPEAGEKSYVSVPPHVMIMNAKLATQSHLPSGQVHPDTAMPFVLLGGTPFAVIILPVRTR